MDGESEEQPSEPVSTMETGSVPAQRYRRPCAAAIQQR
jgi:hypothetical protein